MSAMQNFAVPQGINLHSDDELLPEMLSDALVKTVGFLQGITSHTSSLFQYADWWEHDGLHFDTGRLDFAKLSQMVETPAALLKAMPGDFYVFVGIAPPDFRWYLRFYLDPDAEESERFGRFDVTLPPELVARYQEEVVEPLGLAMHEQEADTYYQSIQA